MWFNINFNTLVLLLLPPFLRKPILSAFAQVLLKPLDTLYYRWYQFRQDNIYKLSHNGQVCSLRKSLNDKFDVSLRRIYIGEGNFFDTTYIYTEGEAQNVYTNTESEPVEGTLYLRTESETADTGLDFIVYVPQEVYDTQIHALHSHIKFYKAGGKRYNIFIIP